MSYQNHAKQRADKNFFMIPNEVFSLGLKPGEYATYEFLVRCEDRKTYQCYPSYKTIGNAIGRCPSSVRKYVTGLVEKHLIKVEPTKITTKDGRTRNGSLLYTILPIREALAYHEAAQVEQLEISAENDRVKKQLEVFAAQGGPQLVSNESDT